MAMFEVTVYNKEVREKVEIGEHHRQYSDSWADFQYIEIDAPDEKAARAKAEEKHPSSQGFVIDDVRSLGGGFE